MRPLNQRQKDVVQKVCQGLKNAEIAALMGVSEKSIKDVLTRIFKKMGVRNRVELVRKEKGIV